MPFRDRAEAGRRLAEQERELRLDKPVVLGLPRGGVPVAAEVAAALHAPLDVFVARKIGLPGHEEFGIGAVAEGIYDPVRSDAVDELAINKTDFEAFAQRERAEVDRRVQLYRQGRALPELSGHDVVLVDDGLATGVTAEAALRSLRAMDPARVVLAAPVCAEETARRLGRMAEAVVCVETPRDFLAVGRWYDDFTQTTDDEVIALLKPAPPSIEEVIIRLNGNKIRANLVIPEGARGLVVLSGRGDLENRYAAEKLQDERFATLVLESADHLPTVIEWLNEHRDLHLPITYYEHRDDWFAAN
jgi:putative phosphoribosyl transferase